MRFNRPSVTMVAAAAALMLGAVPAVMLTAAPAAMAYAKAPTPPKGDIPTEVKAGQTFEVSTTVIANRGKVELDADVRTTLKGAAAKFAAESKVVGHYVKNKGTTTGGAKIDSHNDHVSNWSWQQQKPGEMSGPWIEAVTATFEVKVSSDAKPGETFTIDRQITANGRFEIEGTNRANDETTSVGPFIYKVAGGKKGDGGGSDPSTGKPGNRDSDKSKGEDSSKGADGSKSGASGGSESSSTDRAEGDLAKTGASVGPQVGIGAAVLALAGGGILFARKRRRNG